MSDEISLEDAMSEAYNEVTSVTSDSPTEEITPENNEVQIEEEVETVEAPSESEEISQNDDEQAEVAKEAAKAPAFWPDEMKQHFAKLPPETQEFLLRRESERDAFVEQKSQEYNRIKQQYDSIDSSFDSIRHVLQQNNMTPQQATQEFVALYNFAEQDPVGYANYFLKSKGIDLQQLASGQIDPTQYQQRQLTAKLSALESELNSIKQKGSVEQDQILLSEINKFAADPANKFFEDVKADMALLFEAEKTSDIAEAYKIACAMNPKISAIIEQEKAQARAKQVNAKAQAAKKAAGAKLKTKEMTSATRSASSDNLEDVVREAYRELTGEAAA